MASTKQTLSFEPLEDTYFECLQAIKNVTAKKPEGATSAEVYNQTQICTSVNQVARLISSLREWGLAHICDALADKKTYVLTTQGEQAILTKKRPVNTKPLNLVKEMKDHANANPAPPIIKPEPAVVKVIEQAIVKPAPTQVKPVEVEAVKPVETKTSSAKASGLSGPIPVSNLDLAFDSNGELLIDNGGDLNVKLNGAAVARLYNFLKMWPHVAAFHANPEAIPEVITNPVIIGDSTVKE